MQVLGLILVIIILAGVLMMLPLLLLVYIFPTSSITKFILRGNIQNFREVFDKLQTPLVWIIIAIMAYTYFTVGGGRICFDVLDCSF
jgi:hypothetical protein